MITHRVICVICQRYMNAQVTRKGWGPVCVDGSKGQEHLVELLLRELLMKKNRNSGWQIAFERHMIWRSQYCPYPPV